MSIPCPSCGHPETSVDKTGQVRSDTAPDSTRRVRRCLQCRLYFFTLEVLEDSPENPENDPALS